VDRLQLTETEDAPPYAEGSGGAMLWHAAQLALVNYGGAAENVSLAYKDVAALNGTELSFEQVEPGVQLAVRVDPLQLTRNVRVQFVDKNWDERVNTAVQLESREEELTKRLNRGLG
jgi:hypothetical protein